MRTPDHGAASPHDDIPGTYVFDSRRSRQGYALNMFCMSLNDAANRAAFQADEAGYVDRFALTAEQRKAVLDRDWIGLLRLGGNVYYTFKLAATDGMTFQQLAAAQAGVPEQEYLEMMLAGGRSIDGNRYRNEPSAGGQGATDG